MGKNKCITKRHFNCKHDMSYSPEYIAWACMKARCYNKKHDAYYRYGDRGIVVCDRWLNSFESFYEDMGEKPSIKHSIERKNRNENYTPDNCVWATKHEQARNKSNNCIIYYNGQSMCLKDWAITLNIKYTTLHQRLNVYGWSIERAFTTLTAGYGTRDCMLQYRDETEAKKATS